MTEEIIELKGNEPGPTSMILVGVHGNERCGIEALEKLIPNLTIERGTVYIGYGNPVAIEKNVRFTETNLNRMFKSDEMLSDKDLSGYEYTRAQYLKKYLDKSEALLDVHASFTPESQRFLICESNAKEISQFLPFDLIVSGFDAVEPGGTDYYMNSIGKIGICAECGYLADPTSTQVAEESILAFLKARGHISGDTQSYTQNNIRMYTLYLTETDFIPSKKFKDFEKISENQLIGTDGLKEIRATKDSVILFARNIAKPGDEAFLLGEYEKA